MGGRAALDPNTLRALFTAAIGAYHDTAAYDAALVREAADRARLRRTLPDA